MIKIKWPFKLFKKKEESSVDTMMVDELIHHPEFAKQVRKIQKEILTSVQFSTSHGRKPNKDLKYLIDNGYFTGTSKFIDEYRLILMKVSALPNAYRKALGSIGDKAFNDAVIQLKK